MSVTELIETGRRLDRAGISPGSSGNLSVRTSDRILMSGTGTSLGHLAEEDIAVLDLEGRWLSGARPSKEVPLHAAMYAREPGHRAVVHLHSPQSVAVACLEPWSELSAVPPITPYFLMRVGQTPLIPFVPPGSPLMGDAVLAAPGRFRAALLANHGQVTAGADLAAAADAAVELEEACRITLLTDGRARRLLDPETAAGLAAAWGTHWDDAGAPREAPAGTSSR
ncbi:class II aldolase/adducin family protein [Rothia sp. AR01]|uniref:Class II aldolase/adducin family protein n=1 Tax=Rothia santali TaxID=2949643 RepID=A0A9X2KIN6_9MICC|nr:class II aldolase/adducin family protein [Rothia santali]MCP3427087.1 class II aldolase/adducin family protein [Rothia santali]